MENPASWGPLEKAVAKATEDYHKSFALCDGPEPLDIKAEMMASFLAESGTIKAEDKAAVAKVIEETLILRGSRDLWMISETKQVANALRAAKLAG
jgi:hypothetical protein